MDGWITNVVSGIAVAGMIALLSEVSTLNALASAAQAQQKITEIRAQRVIDNHIDLLQRVSKLEAKGVCK